MINKITMEYMEYIPIIVSRTLDDRLIICPFSCHLQSLTVT